MPAQLRMLRYMKNSEGRGNGPGTPNKTSQSQPLPQTQHAPPPAPAVATRQPLVDLVKDQPPIAGRRTLSQTQAPASIPTSMHPPSRQQVMQPPRSRANSDQGRNHATSERESRDQREQMWEDSTVQSMFAESLGSVRHRGVAAPARYDHNQYSPPRTQRHERVTSTRAPTLSTPFVLGKNGLLEVMSPGNQGGNPRAVTSSHNHRGLSAEAPVFGNPYVDDVHYESSKSQPVPNFHTKVPLRDVRSSDARLYKPDSFTDRFSQHLSPAQGTNGTAISSERFGDISTRIQEPIEAEHVPRGLDHKRSTIFHDINTPITTTPAPPEEDTGATGSPPGNEPPEQRTPRQARLPSSSAPQPQAPAARKKTLQESSLPRHNSQHNKRPSLKRRFSLDYDDSALNAMNYSELKGEPFDHDPARETVRQAAEPPCGDSLEEKLTYYKDKDENTQHHFFTQMSVREWDESGDWFLEQFGNIVNKMKDKRREKRQIVGDFEDEIAAREDAVRGKVISIDTTLEELKKEGEGMINGREADL